jgi:transposase
LTNGAAEPTPIALLDRYASPQQLYVTLTITLPSEEVYTTTILLGDDFPTSLPSDPVQQSTSQPTLTPAAVQNTDSNNPGNVAGIIIGVLGGLAVLAGVFYVYTLRARQYLASNKSVSGSRKRRKKKKRKKSKKSAWFVFKFKLQGKKRRRSRRSSMSTASKS